MRFSTLRPLLLPVTAGLGLSLLSGLPAQAHGIADAGFSTGFSHPITGLDHLLLLVGVGGVAAFMGGSVLLFALVGAVAGAVVGSLGGDLPGAELLAALAISALGVVILASQRSGRSPRLGLIGTLVALAIAVHALLHGQEASGGASWWLGAALGSTLAVAVSYGVLRQAHIRWTVVVAAVLAVSGVVLAFA
ncbi:HupE/UreJ family protein [Cyanobium sp. ATX 6A2]|uniref:HupE/UreJ family protein n=1 Tax=Cyanobium sp. ATX 6A2 TaxID=2823700 RepID=UPI0020CF243E|nr:HupE/UreJ family protein [Cyanobium sp. ATX 6A2]MCP9888183.1 HupE/UreJ family protein [Cyanobium sp. ATX 6A2]